VDYSRRPGSTVRVVPLCGSGELEIVVGPEFEDIGLWSGWDISRGQDLLKTAAHEPGRPQPAFIWACCRGGDCWKCGTRLWAPARTGRVAAAGQPSPAFPSQALILGRHGGWIRGGSSTTYGLSLSSRLPTPVGQLRWAVPSGGDGTTATGESRTRIPDAACQSGADQGSWRGRRVDACRKRRKRRRCWPYLSTAPPNHSYLEPTFAPNGRRLAFEDDYPSNAPDDGIEASIDGVRLDGKALRNEDGSGYVSW